MSTLFETTQIKNMVLKNRFVRSATWEGMAAEDGSSTPGLIDYMVQLAKGGVGLIITGHSYVHPAGQAAARQLGIDRDTHIPGLRSMTDAVHRADGRIVLQIAHGGCAASIKHTGVEAVGPSVFEMDGNALCREMSRDEISGTVNAFGEAAVRAEQAGFDGVQLHAAHGYLLSQFLSPFYNKRKDAYGGSLENRARIVLEAFRAVRNVVSSGFPVLIKLNSEDFLPGGLKKEEMIWLSEILEKEGIDAIEMSGGSLHSDKKLVSVRPGMAESEEKEVFYKEAAKDYKDKIRVPLMLVGGIRSFHTAENLIKEGVADYISMSRPLIREPDMINRWKSGDHGRSACRSDNACFRPAFKGKGLYCVHREKEGADR